MPALAKKPVAMAPFLRSSTLRFQPAMVANTGKLATTPLLQPCTELAVAL